VAQESSSDIGSASVASILKNDPKLAATIAARASAFEKARPELAARMAVLARAHDLQVRRYTERHGDQPRTIFDPAQERAMRVFVGSHVRMVALATMRRALAMSKRKPAIGCVAWARRSTSGRRPTASRRVRTHSGSRGSPGRESSDSEHHQLVGVAYAGRSR